MVRRLGLSARTGAAAAPALGAGARRAPRAVVALNAALTAAAVAVVVAGRGVGGAHRWPGPAWVAVPLVVTLVLAASLRVAYRYGTELEDLDVFEAVVAPVLLLFGVGAAVGLVVVAKLGAELLARRAPIKAWFNVAQWALATGLGAIVLAALGTGGAGPARVFGALAVALVAVSVVNHGALIAVMSIVSHRSPAAVLREMRTAIASGWIVGGGLNMAFGLLGAAAAAGAPLVTPLFVVPLAVLHLASRHLAQEQAARGLRRSVQDAAEIINRPVDPRDALEPFLANAVGAFAARAVRLVLLADGTAGVHHLDAEARTSRHWEDLRAAAAATRVRAATVLRPADDGAADLLGEGWGESFVAPMRADDRTFGVLCVLDAHGFTHDREGHLAALESMAAGATNAVARAEMVEEVLDAHRRSELLLVLEGQALESIASGEELPASLDEVVRFVEAAVPQARCSIAVAPVRAGGEGHAVGAGGAQPAATSSAAWEVVIGDGPPPPPTWLAELRRDGPDAEMTVVDDVHGPRWGPLGAAWDDLRSCWLMAVTPGATGTVGLICVAHPAAAAVEVGDTERAAMRVARRLARLAVERALSRERLLHEARHDRLTGLGNRAAFLEATEGAKERGRRTGQTFGVLFVDLDRFKYVNDSMGHEAGDALLVAVAHRLRQLVRATDAVARHGGDEFTVLCDGLDPHSQPLAVARRVVHALAKPYDLGGRDVVITASIGVAIGDATATATELIERADAAMYRAKERGRNRIEVFDELTRERSGRQLFEQTELRRALDAGQLVVHYQPIFTLADLSLGGVEALVRWPQHDGTLRAPDSFIGLAEETGLILPLGDLVLAEVCRQAQRWRHGNPRHRLRTSVNVSARQITQGDLVEKVERALRETGLPADALTIEITESTLLEVTESAKTLARLRDVGVAVAVDDFGSGYSSLNYLRRLPIDVVKLDRVFVQEIATDHAARAIVAAVVQLADALDLTVVAEGIESGEQLRLLRDLGCTMGQGYYLGAPGDAGALDRTFAAGFSAA